MIFISHRGNIDGKISDRENDPIYIDEALLLDFDVEIDFWFFDGRLFLGHDYGKYEINLDWILSRSDRLWIHCKNPEGINFLKELEYKIQYFWHENDKLTLTSLNEIWVYPGNQPIYGSISVLPEQKDEDISNCRGVCSDFIQIYKKKLLNE